MLSIIQSLQTPRLLPFALLREIRGKEYRLALRLVRDEQHDADKVDIRQRLMSLEEEGRRSRRAIAMGSKASRCSSK